MLFSVEQAFVGREEIRAPLKTPAWEASVTAVPRETENALWEMCKWRIICLDITKFRRFVRKFGKTTAQQCKKSTSG